MKKKEVKDGLKVDDGHLEWGEMMTTATSNNEDDIQSFEEEWFDMMK